MEFKFMKKLYFITALIIVASLGVMQIVTRVKKEPERIKIGAIAPFTGPASIWGEQFKKGIKLALAGLTDEMRSSLDIIYEDSEADPKKAISAVQKLIAADKVKAIIGPLSSNEVLSVAPIVERAKVVLLTPTAPHNDIRYAGDYIFRIYPSDKRRSIMLADYTNNELKAKRVGIIFRGDEFGIAVRQEYVERLKELDLKEESIISEKYDPGNTDFRTIISKMKNFNPQVVLIVGHSKELGFIVRQSYEIKFSPQFLSTADFENPEVLKIAGKSAEGVIYGSLIFDAKSLESPYRSFIEKYHKLFDTNEEPGIVTALSYDAFNIICEAIKNSNPIDSERIKMNLYKIKNYPGVTGKITFDRYGDVTKTWGLKIVKDGQFHILIEQYPAEVN